MLKVFIVLFLIYPTIIFAQQDCEKIVVNHVVYPCQYDGHWDISQGNLAVIVYVKSRSTGKSHTEYVTKDFLDKKFYDWATSQKVDFGKYDKEFTLQKFKVKINHKRYKPVYLYEKMYELELKNFKDISEVKIKRKRIYIEDLSEMKR